jgi:purine-binding chemotaxis protein CheW
MMQLAEKPKFDSRWQGHDNLEVLTFDLNGETFALEASVVQEILDLVPETMVPGAPRFVGKVINFRGRVIPLADVRLPFGMESREPTIDSRIIVISLDFDGEAVLVGLLTDKVNEVTTLPRTACEPPPRVGMRWRSDYIHCLVKRGGEFIIFPDLDAIFSLSKEA